MPQDIVLKILKENKGKKLTTDEVAKLAGLERHVAHKALWKLSSKWGFVRQIKVSHFEIYWEDLSND